MTYVQDWIQELIRSVRQRYLESNPGIDKQELMIACAVTTSEDKKYLRVIIGGVDRFALSKKNEYIYGIKRGIVNKKEDYKHISNWQAWDWKPFYPYKRDLYAWKDYEKTPITPEKAQKARRVISRIKVAESVEGRSWPYTKGSSKPDGNQSGDNREMGTDQASENRKRSGTPGKNHSKSHKRKGD